MKVRVLVLPIVLLVAVACTQPVATPVPATIPPVASAIVTATRQPSLTQPPTLAVSPTLSELATSSPIVTPIPLPTTISTATPIRLRTPVATSGPITRRDLADTLSFSGFTHMPVDFHAVLGTMSTCPIGPRLEPFFNYYNTSHAEGPKKWYIWACPGDLVKVYLPAKGVLFDWGIQAVGREGGIEGQFNGENVLINVNAQFDVSSEITVFYMHLTLREEIITMVQASPNRVVILDAGTHIGYMYWPPPSPYYSLDFGVLDRDFDSGLTPFPGHFLNTRANPLDYFTDDLRISILEAYQKTYDTLVEEGVTPYSDIEDSRANFYHQNTIWGLWFKEDLVEAWDGSAWSIVSLVRKADLHQETYWKTLEDFPTMSGLFVEQAIGEVVGKPLYPGQPIRRSKFHIVSGNERVGVARIGEDRGNNPRTIYLKYELRMNTANRFDDRLMIESFQTLEEAVVSGFSGEAVLFRREPCNSSIHKCF